MSRGGKGGNQLVQEVNFYQAWKKSRWFKFPKAAFQWSGILSLLSILALSVTGEISKNTPLGDPDPIPMLVRFAITVPLFVLILSIFAWFISWILALFSPSIIETTTSIAKDHRRLTGRDR